jgi:phosphoglycerate dehydrogenase-like enzyme
LTTSIAVAPAEEAPWLSEAVREAGGQIVPIEKADGLIWFGTPDGLKTTLSNSNNLRWIQLPAAGIEAYLPLIRASSATWTAAKGVYADTCAEQAIGLAIAGFRNFPSAIQQRRWHKEPARSLFDSRVTIVGAGGIAQSLIRLLAPFNASITIVRRQTDAVAGVRRTVRLDRLRDALGDADLVILASALTAETEGIIGEPQLRAMKQDAWLINVARGKLVKTNELVRALQQGWIAGAGLDVTDPEPLPDDHPLWRFDNCIITSHTANPPNLERDYFRRLVVDNVRRFLNREPLIGVIDREAGY